ncbi:hypothetical protein NMG60_11032175 [Bertholletia excelsa]
MAEDEHGSASCCSTSNPCPICLGPLVQESYLDQCFHKFCYNCIVHWTKVVSSKHSHPPLSLKCPLCKTENFSIIHGYDGYSFERHHINQDFGNNAFFSKAHKYRLQCYYTEPVALAEKIKIPRFWKSQKYLQPNQWLQRWLTREIQALIQEEDIDVIVHHVLGVIDSFRRDDQKSASTPEAKQETFKSLVSEAAKPFFAGRSERFASEVEIFLASGLNIEAYDKVYLQLLGWNRPGITTKEEEGEPSECKPLVPYLHLFDEDSDGTD